MNLNFERYNTILEVHLLKKLKKAGYDPSLVRFATVPNFRMGDFAIPAFEIAKFLKEIPTETAEEVAKKAREVDIVDKVEVKGPFVNIFFKREEVAKLVLSGVLNAKGKFGASLIGKREKVLVEFSSPNTNKPQHIGHIRNNLIGESISRILKHAGAGVSKMNLVNDRGIHICKSMLAYKKWGNGVTPESSGKKGDHLVGDFYVMFGIALHKEKEEYFSSMGIDYISLHDEEKREVVDTFLKQSLLMKEALEILTKWEKDDKEIKALWKKMNGWVMEGFDKTYKDLGVSFDEIVFESNLYGGGKEVVEKAFKNGIFKKTQKGIVAPLEKKFNLPDKVVLRSDGTSLYATQDINLAIYKFKNHSVTSSVYVIGSEQDLYLKQLFAILKLLKFSFADKSYHLSYGMVYLPEGKMKSSEGKVVDADDLILRMKELAEKELLKRDKNIQGNELERKAGIIGLAALKFFILRFRPHTDIHFDPKKSIKFEGETGPYVQYVVARINSIVRESGAKNNRFAVDYSLINSDIEHALILELAKFPLEVSKSALKMDPSIVAEYLLNLGKIFNRFYHKCPVLVRDDKRLRDSRLFLISRVKDVFEEGLWLLGIELVERM